MGICGSTTNKQKDATLRISHTNTVKAKVGNKNSEPAKGVTEKNGTEKYTIDVNAKVDFQEGNNVVTNKNEERQNAYLDNNNSIKNGIAINSNTIIGKGEGNPFELYTKEKKLGEGSFG